jgi:FkbM family methyltransferase
MISAAAHLGRWLGNQLYNVAFPIYRPLYGAFKTYSDRAERRLLSSCISQGCVVVDAGANIGIYSKFLSRCVGPSGLVHSFEPSPDNFARLHAALTDFPNVRLNQIAVSDRTGGGTLYISDTLNVDHRAYPSRGAETRRTVLIQTIRLDDYFRRGERVDLIKMDVQGFELHALRGAQRTLADNPKVKLLLEFWPYGLHQAGGSPQALISFLEDHGLRPFVLRNGSLVEHDLSMSNPTDPDIYMNVFVQPARAK